MDTTQFLSHLKQLPWYQGQVQHTEQMPARRARHATSLTPLAPAVAAALQLRGVRQLFLHQAAAVDHLLQARCCTWLFLAVLCLPCNLSCLGSSNT